MRSGFSQQYISGLERGRRNPTIVTLYELAQALDASHVDLLQPDNEICQAARSDNPQAMNKNGRPVARRAAQTSSVLTKGIRLP